MTASGKVFTAITQRADIASLKPPISKDHGESVLVAPVADDPNTLFKEFRPGACTRADDDRLDRLIALPRRLSTEDRRLLVSASCWPISRVMEGGHTVGVLLPRAPAKFEAPLRSATGTSDPKPIAVDWLAKTAEQQAVRGLPPMGFEQRLRVCRDIVAVAAILEQEGVVYGDWSYANAFWSPSDFSGYLIDVDSCAFGSRPWVGTPNWEDPLTGPGRDVDSYTDRYRLALLVARCLTGERDNVSIALKQVRAQSDALGMSQLGQLLTGVVCASSRSARPSVEAMLNALSGRSQPQHATNVSGWVNVQPNAFRAGTARPSARQSTPTPAPNSQPAPEPLSKGCAITAFVIAIAVALLILTGAVYLVIFLFSL
jgi:hypothetical protein